MLLLVCFLAGSVALWQQRKPHDRRSSKFQSAAGEPSSNVAAPEGETHARPADSIPEAPPAKAVTAAPMPGASNPHPAPAGDGRTGQRYKRAYMLSLDKGTLALVGAQDIEGDFAPRRGREEEWSNMLRFRLLSESHEVLAEELLPAPDQVCHVLDPRASDGKAADFTTPGPVTFQVRLPRVKGASRLDIFRILQPGEPATENLLGSFPLPRS